MELIYLTAHYRILITTDIAVGRMITRIKINGRLTGIDPRPNSHQTGIVPLRPMESLSHSPQAHHRIIVHHINYIFFF